MGELTPEAARNRELWTQTNADYTHEQGRRAWAQDEISWGIWSVPEADVGALAGIELDGADVIELGCGTAYVSAWLARRGARPVGVDVTPAQLETARQLQSEHGLDFPLLEANAERRAAARRRLRPRDLGVRRAASGAIRTGGSPKRHGCSVRAAGSSSSATRRS